MCGLSAAWYSAESRTVYSPNLLSCCWFAIARTKVARKVGRLIRPWVFGNEKSLFKLLKATCTHLACTVPEPKIQHEKRDLDLLILGAACPLKPAPTGLRNAGLTILPVVERRLMLFTRRAGCHESGSSSSREALTSNPFPSWKEQSVSSIPWRWCG